MISIVIPIYNAAQYLSQCLDSLLCQTNKEWEAILIDDGSSDESAEICNLYRKKDQRFRVVIKHNEGVSITRNRALKLCKGNYLFFLDADDYLLSKECLQTLETTISQNSVDLVRFEYQAVDENNVKLFDNSNRFLRKKYCSIPIPVAEYCTKVVRNEYFLCLNLLRNDIIQRNNICFLEGCRMREDAAFLLTYLGCCNSVVYLPNVYYAYRKHNRAVTVGNKIWGKYSKDLSLVFDSIYLNYQNIDRESFRYYLEYFLSDLIVDLRNSEYYDTRYVICKTFKNKSLLYRCLSFGSFSDCIIAVVTLVKRIMIKVKKMINGIGS